MGATPRQPRPRWGDGSVCVEVDPDFDYFAGCELFARIQIVARGSSM